ncbi:MAG: phosphatase PAP2 family protein [Pseudomonadota bacterium]
MRTWLQRLNDIEAPWCVAWNRQGRRRRVKRFFQIVSRLGDGVVWYVTMALLPLYFGSAGLLAGTHMLLVGLASLLVYKLLKQSTHRPRPCNLHGAVAGLMPALDEFSFPSGHTLHAVAFTTVLAFHFPELALLFLPFTLLVAISRLVLGLHYPSDVVTGALLGGLLAGASFLVL